MKQRVTSPVATSLNQFLEANMSGKIEFGD